MSSYYLAIVLTWPPFSEMDSSWSCSRLLGQIIEGSYIKPKLLEAAISNPLGHEAMVFLQVLNRILLLNRILTFLTKPQMLWKLKTKNLTFMENSFELGYLILPKTKFWYKSKVLLSRDRIINIIYISFDHVKELLVW